MRRVLPLLLLLAACGREGAEAPPAEPASFRDRTVPIGATTRGQPTDLNGDWVVSAAFRAEPPRGVGPGDEVQVALEPSGRGRWTFANPAGAWLQVPVASPQPGRYEVSVPQPAARAAFATEAPVFVVLWVDDDFRTAAVGTPDGTFGWIMDRPGAASPDRTAAAREVLDWGGYDLARLAP